MRYITMFKRILISALTVLLLTAGLSAAVSEPVLALAREAIPDIPDGETASGRTYVYKGQDYSRVFSPSYYAAHYPAVKKRCGTDAKKLLRNFVRYGMKKGRRGSASFDVKSYIYGNQDLRIKYKNDLSKYYLHYQNRGYKSAKRKGTAVGIKRMKDPVTVLKGVDYSPVYDYSYYIKKRPELLKKYGYRDTRVLKYFVKYDFPKDFRAKKSISKSDRAEMLRRLIARDLPATNTASKTKQIIVVVDHDLSLWQKAADGSWKRAFRAYCGYGKNGFSANRHEGDKTTPVGSFPILHAFGTADDADTDMTWKQITETSYWSGEPGSYNTWVESPYRISGEHLIDYYQYKYAMAIGFNRNPTVRGKGSAIFLHCKSTDHWYTAGCIGVREKYMKRLLKACRNGTYIIMVPKESDLKKY